MRKIQKKRKYKIIETIDNNNLGSLSRTFLGSIIVVSLFYVLPLMINFANDNILITKEFKNNSKQVLAYTLDKKTNNTLDENEIFDEKDLLVDIYNLNDKETDASHVCTLDSDGVRHGYVPNTPKPNYKNHKNITIPNACTKDPDSDDAKMYELQDWQRVLLDDMSADLLDCIVNTHDDYIDLENHTYLDKKGWSREQKYTFQKCVRQAYKTSDGRYCIPIIFNEKIKKLSNSKHLAHIFETSLGACVNFKCFVEKL